MAEPIKFTLEVDDNGSLTIKKFGEEVDNATKSTAGLGDALSVLKASGIVYLAEQAMNAANKIWDLAKSYVDFGHDIEENSRILGMSTTQYQQWTYAAAASGASAENMMNSMKFLSRAVMEAQAGTGRGAEAFKTMGISVKDAQGKTKDLDTLMMEIVGKMGQWADGPNKMALGMALFGRGFLSIMPMINEGGQGLDELKQKAIDVGAVLGEDSVEKLAKSKAAFETLSVVWKAFTAEVLAPMVSVLASILEWVTKVIGGLSKLPSQTANYWKQMEAETGYDPLAGVLPAEMRTAAPPGVITGVMSQAAIGKAWSEAAKPEAPGLMDLKKQTEQIQLNTKAQEEFLKAQLTSLKAQEEVNKSFDFQREVLEKSLAINLQILNAKEQQAESAAVQKGLNIDALRSSYAQQRSALYDKFLADSEKINLKESQRDELLIKASGLEKEFVSSAEQLAKLDEEGAKRDKDRLDMFTKINTLVQEGIDLRAAGERAVAKATIDAQGTLGLLRPGQVGLANIGISQADITDQLTKQKATLNDLVAAQAKVGENSMDYLKYQEQIQKTLNDITGLENQWNVLEAEKLKYISEIAPAYDGLLAGLKKYVTSAGTLYDQLSSFAQNAASGMESSFSSFFQSMTDKTKTWSQKMQGFFKDMANAFIKALSDMAAKALVTNLLGGITGGTGGLGNILSGLLGGGGGSTSPAQPVYSGLENTWALGAAEGAIYKGGWTPIAHFAQGGVVKSPMLGWVGEGGQDEAVIPLQGGEVPIKTKPGVSQGPSVPQYNVTIIAADARSFSDMMKRNPDAVIGIVDQNIKRGGQLKTSVRGA